MACRRWAISMWEPPPGLLQPYRERDYQRTVNDKWYRGEIRRIIYRMEDRMRNYPWYLEAIYTAEGIKNIPDICEKGREMFKDVCKGYNDIIDIVQDLSEYDYARYCTLWFNFTRSVLFKAAFIVFLESKTLLDTEEAYKFLNLSPDSGICVTKKDLVFSWLSVTEKLPRLIAMATQHEYYDLHFEILTFMDELGRHLIELCTEDEALLKKIYNFENSLIQVEGIIYDLSVRKIITYMPLQAENNNQAKDRDDHCKDKDKCDQDKEQDTCGDEDSNDQDKEQDKCGDEDSSDQDKEQQDKCGNEDSGVQNKGD